MSLFQTVLQSITDRLKGQGQDLHRVSSIISTIIGIPISAEQITIKKGILYIQVPPTVRFSILSKKELIIAACKKELISISTIA